MKKTPFALHATACALALWSCAAIAQTPPTPAVPATPATPEPLAGPMRHNLMVIAGNQLDRGRTVTGQPYCADATHESVQPLPDGNRIVQKHSSKQCRDGQGRTRQEVSAGTHRHVFLRDPVSGESWMLEPETKQATRLDMRRPNVVIDHGMVERIREWGREVREHFRPRPEGSASAPESSERQHIVIREVQRGPGSAPMAVPPMPPMPPMPPVAGLNLQTRLIGPRGAGQSNSLPPETIEGVKAEGTRTTWTIEAGKIGNEKPILITSEVWRSPELGITLRSRDVDPLVGENTFRLQNLQRGEPDAQLFKVPADYRKAEPRGMPPLPPVPPVPPAAPGAPAAPAAK